MKISLLISTYNWPEALSLVFKSIASQSKLPNEILIADDGSGKKTKRIIQTYQRKLPVPIYHFWHEDKGFRKATILNKALSAAEGDYIIQADGDCILHKDFVLDHAANAENNTYLYGSRVSIKEDFLPQLYADEKIKFNFWSKGISKRTRTLRIPFLSYKYKPSAVLSKKVRGCNISYWKKDIFAVNGYNENFTGWGREDSELIIRMMNNGVCGKRIRYKGILYHIWHHEESKIYLKKNDKIERECIAQNKRWCRNGIIKQ